MRSALRPDRNAGIKTHPKRDGIDDPSGRVGNRRRDTGTVRHLISIRNASADRGGDRIAGDITRRHHHRKAQRENAIAVVKLALVFDANADRSLGVDAGHRRRKDVGPLLLQQGGFFAFGFGFFVDLPGFFAFFDLAHNHTLTNTHFKRIDRGVFGQRENINTLKPGIGRVMKILRDHRPGDKARHVDLDIRSQHGRSAQHQIVIASHQQRAGFGLFELHRLAKRCRTGGIGPR